MTTRLKTSSACKARSPSSTPSPRWARRSCRSCSHTEDYVHALGAISGGQAVQMAKAGLKAIYLSGWQVAGDANDAGQVYPDQSLYPANSGPSLVKRINNALASGRRDRVGRRQRRQPTTCCRSSPTPRPASEARSTCTS